MKRDAIKDLMESLACSQGFYGRILESIDEMNDDDQDMFWSELEAQNFRDDLDVIMFFEC